jgi:hypothetical protein
MIWPRSPLPLACVNAAVTLLTIACRSESAIGPKEPVLRLATCAAVARRLKRSRASFVVIIVARGHGETVASRRVAGRLQSTSACLGGEFQLGPGRSRGEIGEGFAIEIEEVRTGSLADVGGKSPFRLGPDRSRSLRG